jgi:hypothetical protein
VLPEDIPAGRYRLSKEYSISPQAHAFIHSARATFVVNRTAMGAIPLLSRRAF